MRERRVVGVGWEKLEGTWLEDQTWNRKEGSVSFFFIKYLKC